MNLKRLAPLTLAVALWGCSKKPGPASAEFSKAQGQFLNLLNQKPLDVYGDPALNGILTTLDAVPTDSISHEAAVSLATQIRAGQAEYAKTAQEKAAAVASSNKAPPTGPAQPYVATAPSTAPTPPPADPTGGVDAGVQGPVGGPQPGMSAADFSSKFGLCFSRTSTYTTTAKDSRGDVYSLNEQAACLAKYPSYRGQLVLVAGGSVQRLASKADVVSQETMTVNQPVQIPVANPNGTPAPAPQPQPQPVQPQPARPPQTSLPDATPPPPPANTPPQDPNFNPDAVNK
jgi:hypothetical protein